MKQEIMMCTEILVLSTRITSARINVALALGAPTSVKPQSQSCHPTSHHLTPPPGPTAEFASLVFSVTEHHTYLMGRGQCSSLPAHRVHAPLDAVWSVIRQASGLQSLHQEQSVTRGARGLVDAAAAPGGARAGEGGGGEEERGSECGVHGTEMPALLRGEDAAVADGTDGTEDAVQRVRREVQLR
ncbi:hypothetical protein Fmac_018740 [Flemingia macrophylla]|uniref:Uncharacterized protein n=1 Tax=Flemingia macrophylla TaxID=520843 RepID=A0ABD1M5V4_9FABA